MPNKLVCLIRQRPHTTWFVNQIHARHPVDLVIIEKPAKKGSLKRVLKAKGWKGLLAFALKRLLGSNKEREVFDRMLGPDWPQLHPEIKTLTTESINSDEVFQTLTSLQPDVILDHGTSIVKDHILDTAGLALNLHWGLSPYYRGVACTEWALLNWDPYNIGVTIHKLSKGIDGGDIIGQERVVVAAEDTVLSINLKLTMAGTPIAINVLDRLDRGEPLNFQKQDASFGFLSLKRHYNPLLENAVRYLVKSGRIREMLKHPSRKEKLPIVELDQSQ